MSDFRQPAGVHLGAVYLRVSDLARSLEFYGDLLGLSVLPAAAAGVAPAGSAADITLLAADPGGPPLLGLLEHPGVGHRPDSSLGLYHFALLLPERLDLARLVHRLLNQRWPIEGASDHMVSEAVYVSDPDGIRVGLYVDRPANLWRWGSNGIVMRPMPLDLPGLLLDFRAELDQWTGIAPGTTVGHIHLNVSDLSRAESFYHDLLKFEVTTRACPGALMMAADRYHHHIGLSTGAGDAVGEPDAGVAGLVAFEVVIPDPEARDLMSEDVKRQGFHVVSTTDAWETRDYDGNHIVVRG